MSDVLLRAEGLHKSYAVQGTARERILRQTPPPVRALVGVDIEVARGESVAVVGESGSGKTTLARAILMLERPDAGRIVLDGVDLLAASSRQLRASRRQVQAVFQDPASSLNPRRRVWDLVTHALWTHGVARGRRQRRAAASELLEMVELRAADADRLPHEMSLGQRQRIAIARALALRPALVVADEPVSALDVSVQAQILVLLERLQGELGLSYVFISHDLRVVRHLCRRLYVMTGGEVVEEGLVDDVFAAPAHPYTQKLLASVPRLSVGQSSLAGPGGADD
jgi:ABC-type glutathione transport system ATPase component